MDLCCVNFRKLHTFLMAYDVESIMLSLRRIIWNINDNIRSKTDLLAKPMLELKIKHFFMHKFYLAA